LNDDQDDEDDDTDDDRLAGHEVAEGLDDVPGDRAGLVGRGGVCREDQAGRCDVQDQTEERRHQQQRREDAEVQRADHVDRGEQDHDGQRDIGRDEEVHQGRRKRHHQDDQQRQERQRHQHVAMGRDPLEDRRKVRQRCRTFRHGVLCASYRGRE
jgi:hypothetical protein